MPNIKPAGDCALTIEFDNEISISVNQQVHELDHRLQALALPGIVETVPAYRTLIVYYRPETIGYSALARQIQGLFSSSADAVSKPKVIVELPVLYGGFVPSDTPSRHYDGMDGKDTAPDLEEVLAYEHIDKAEFIRRHTANLCYVYFQAFAVGHSYVGNPEKLFSVPRRASPRTKIPQGSVAIWADQTVLNGFDLPCGWNVIGRTPVLLYDERKPEPSFCQPGQWIRFVSIGPEEYHAIHRQALAGTYVPHVSYGHAKEGYRK